MILKKNINKGLVIVIVLTVVFYAGFLLFTDLNSIGELFFQINFWFIPLILILRFLAIILRSFRQKLFLHSLGIRIPLKFNTLVYLAGLSMFVTPASSGTMIKSYFLNKKFGIIYSKTIPVIITEKYHDILAPIIFISIVLFFIDISDEIQIIAIISGIIMLLFYFILAKKKNILQTLIHKTSKIKFLNKFESNLFDNYDSFHSLSNYKTFILGFLVGISSIFIDGLAIFFGFLSLGVDFGFLNSVAIVYTANILGLISFIPGGFGVVEVTLLGLLLQSGFVLAVAASMLLITRLSSVWFQIFVGFIVQFYLLKKIPF